MTTPEREKYLKSISLGERIGRWCLKEWKAEIKMQKRYMNEHKNDPFRVDDIVSGCKKMIKIHKQKLAKVKHLLRRDSGHG